MFPRPIIAITLVVAFISQDVSVFASTSVLLQTSMPSVSVFVQASSNVSSQTSPSVTPASSSISSTTVTTPNTTLAATTQPRSSTVAAPATDGTSSATSPLAPTGVSTTKPPQKPTCGKVTFVWKKPWNDSYVNNTQFVTDTKNELKAALSKYEEVEVSKLQVTNEKGDTLVNFTLCLANRDKNSYIEDELTDKLEITGLKFEASGVTFKDWKAKDCLGCSTGGPITIERECEPKEQYSCNGVKIPSEESNDCVKYCSAGVQKREISTFILVLGIVLAFSVNFWK
ncbi:uncharacterized protein [Porites lutea]|uniref:uncharacterized protein n=1 Tax=Porites lutea TaxID=51062 RepID=UPI003CC688A0